MNLNEHVDAFLDYYLNDCLEPDFAVMLKGKWGCGKSYYIKNYLNTHGLVIKDNFTEEQKSVVLYLSLYGVNTKEEINEKILEKLHPIICSSKIDLLRKILKTVSATEVLSALSVYLTGSEMPKNALVESVDIFIDCYRDKIKKDKPGKIVLVLDDFERANMPIVSLLGFVNECVEMLHIPCIIVAEKNILEEAMEKQKKESTMYGIAVSLEKIIGKEFEIRASFEDVVSFWVKKCSVVEENKKTLIYNGQLFEQGDDSKKIFEDNIDLIVSVIRCFKTDNLRAMKRTLVNFNRFLHYTKIYDKIRSKEDFARLFLGDFLLYQYAKEIGVLNENLRFSPELLQDAGVAYQKDGTYSIDKEQDYITKEIPSLRNNLKDGSYDTEWRPLWKEWIESNSVDLQKLNNTIDNSIWFNKRDSLLLNNLCNWKELDSDESLKDCLDAYERAKKKGITNPVMLVHLFDSLMSLAKNENIIKTPSELVQEMKTYVENNWENFKSVDNDVLIINQPENEETTEFGKFVAERIRPKKEVLRDKFSPSFFEKIKSDDLSNYEMAKLMLTGQEPSIDCLDLKKEDAEAFKNLILASNRSEINELSRCLKIRYLNDKTYTRFSKEKEFVDNLYTLCKNERTRHSKPLPLKMNNLLIVMNDIEALRRGNEHPKV